MTSNGCGLGLGTRPLLMTLVWLHMFMGVWKGCAMIKVFQLSTKQVFILYYFVQAFAVIFYEEFSHGGGKGRSGRSFCGFSVSDTLPFYTKNCVTKCTG